MNTPLTVTSQVQKSTNDRILKSLIPSVIEKLWDLNPELFMGTIEELFMRPKPYQIRDREKMFMSKAVVDTLFIEDTFQTITTYEWRQEKSNAPVVLVSHGWAARSSQMVTQMQGLFEKGYTVISYDQTAHGLSTGSSTNLFDFILVQSRVLQRFTEVEYIVAHSMACSATLVNLSTHPWIRKATLISPHRDILQEIGYWFSRAGIQGKLLERIIHNMSGRYNLNFEEVRGRIAHSLKEKELLIIHDTEDSECPYHEAEKLHYEAPKSSFMKTEGLGHFRIIRSSSVLEKMATWMAEPAKL
ncbi:MAG: hypothetical protein COW00_07220 [Bdellovibrio sp. CG12_big_fil_rev_8_21_14_0_65_39_13]|nr:MAG: hypothetical protein COW78_17000 [Bdellovibrio sp. CG22_combo_CG10-13_8_21_14_all_39_27]PIQ60277.1 MAG: hypothetical protein COW00_07220 [Bdellovibrio sp. CG12_big_fil_rev_8_21_14_0_65_39_13]PIR34713.1 MAG: hypothetical protein COV37_12325 [Bdellovibrio sp. CG11_big_fil_rev_8_21_14_0_20_39_38]PJB53315.1 MAG: hypothetical protein CO099_07815 [Bdellovibrio sp. CG_4_9_14_3_um_filter_39_7]